MSQEFFREQGTPPDIIIPSWQPGYGSLNSLLSVIQGKNVGAEVVIYGLSKDGEGISVGIRTPFLFDRRVISGELDDNYPHLSIGSSITDGFPPEFLDLVKPRTEKFYPENFQAYVARYLDKIREALGLPDLTQEEALDALVPSGDFQNWQEQCSEWRRQDQTPGN